MSTRTIIEINHDYLTDANLESLVALWHALSGSVIPGRLNASGGRPVQYQGSGIRILAQRHHSETLNLKVE